MSLVLKKTIPKQGLLGLWAIEEEESYFRECLELSAQERAELEQIKGRRRKEWLAVRWLLHNMSEGNKRNDCLKDHFGKPYIPDSPYEISFSHSRGMAAAVAAPRICGIDIQQMVDKIHRIAHKFMRKEEMDSLQTATKLEHLHVYWGAKEALYKAFGKRELDFKENIFIEPFVYRSSNYTIKGSIQKNNVYQKFDLWYEPIDEYMLVYGIRGDN